jgi:two-component system chemotaxis response regulator CheB
VEPKIVVMGASAGGVEALTKVVKPLPEDLNAAVFIVLHRNPFRDSYLPEILSRSGRLPAFQPAGGEPIEASKIYIAPSDLHMVLTSGRVHLSHGPKENGFRPAVDPLFRSAAEAHGANVVGVILSGGLTDGAEGLRAIVDGGGFAIVQDPNEAPFQGMPASALEMGSVDFTLPAAAIGPTISNLVAGRIEKRRIPEAQPGPNLSMDVCTGGNRTAYTCPECHGVLWEVGENAKHYRCRVGHTFSMSSLVEAQDGDQERALFAALRTLEESGSLARRLAEGASKHHHHLIARRFAERAKEKEDHAAALRELLYAPGRQPGHTAARNNEVERIDAKSVTLSRRIRRTKAAK